MPIQCSLSTRQEDALTRLRSANRRELRSLFQECSAPAMKSMCGEYDAELLDQGGETAGRITQALFGIHGQWLGKAFNPTNDRSGVGYNRFSEGGLAVQKIEMDTLIAPSTIATGESMFIRYDGRHAGPVRWLVGELREVTEGVILGMGLYGPKWGERDRIRRKIPFVMVGPTREYQLSVEQINETTSILSGKISVPRKGWVSRLMGGSLDTAK